MCCMDTPGKDSALDKSKDYEPLPSIPEQYENCLGAEDDAEPDAVYKTPTTLRKQKRTRLQQCHEDTEEQSAVHSDAACGREGSKRQKGCKRQKKNVRFRLQQKGRGSDPVLNSRVAMLEQLTSSALNKQPGKEVRRATSVVSTPAARKAFAMKMQDGREGPAPRPTPTWTSLLSVITSMQHKNKMLYHEQLTEYMQNMFGAPGSSEKEAAFMAKYSQTLVEVRNEIRIAPGCRKRKREGFTKNYQIEQDMDAKRLVLNDNMFPARLWGSLRLRKLRAMCSLMDYCAAHGLFNMRIEREADKTEPVSGWSSVCFDEAFAWIWFTIWREAPKFDSKKSLSLKTVVMKTMRDELTMRLWMQDDDVQAEGGPHIRMRAHFDFRENFAWTALFGTGLYKYDNKTPQRVVIYKENVDDPIAVCNFQGDGKKRRVLVDE